MSNELAKSLTTAAAAALAKLAGASGQEAAALSQPVRPANWSYRLPNQPAASVDITLSRGEAC